jgi:cystathionine beta-lyase/cystathionine gamma-synthase
MTDKYREIETKLIHAGEPRLNDTVVLPIFQTAMQLTPREGKEEYDDIKYLRLNNSPNHEVLGRKLASLENAEAGLVTASGMAAITTSLLTVLKQGDHLLAQDCLYGGTHEFVTRDLPALGIEHDFIDGADPASWSDKIKTNTRAIYVESISNPLMGVTDLAAAVEFARANDLVSLVDNTFASPVNFRPPEWGFDYSLHSCTKYMNGHSDIVAGAVIGTRQRVENVRRKLNLLGGSLDPHACFLLQRGMKTLALRIRQQNANALRIARFLEEHPAVAAVNYPGLESNPEHARASRFFDGYGGMLSFELAGGLDAARRLMNTVSIPLIAPSLGSVETLMTRPAGTSHSGLTPEEREAIGIRDGLVRMSVGIESGEELVEDLRRGLDG